MIIGIDFDGTCVTHDFPRVGKNIGSVPVLKKLVEKGHQLILFTMRGNKPNPEPVGPEIIPEGGDHLTTAVNWFKENDIPLYGIQTNPTQKNWTNSPKAYCQLYIDDAALGIPLTDDPDLSDRPYVDWDAVEDMLLEMNLIGGLD